jgi:hypothetical protein
MISTLVRELSDGETPLDRDRASSIADEGGKSAAAVEAQRPPTPTSAPIEEDGTDLDATPPFPRQVLEMNKRIGNL